HDALMERAASVLRKTVMERYGDKVSYILVAGPGNNGGDALALARQLSERGCSCRVLLVADPSRLPEPAATNYNRLISIASVPVFVAGSDGKIPEDYFGPDSQRSDTGKVVIIDGLFGSGLNRRPEGTALEIIKKINSSRAVTVSIDIPSGMNGEDNRENDPSGVVKADLTITFQYPKLSMLLPGYGSLCKEVVVADIGLHPEALSDFRSDYYYTTEKDILSIIKPREKFSHKGDYGSALLIAGSRGKAGAAVMASRAVLRCGAGLLTVHLPSECLSVVQTAVPEAMCSVDTSANIITSLPVTGNYSAIGAGPGLGTDPQTGTALYELIASRPKQLVLDADAINLISADKKILEMLPANTILTPHVKEFERMAGPSPDPYSRLLLQREFSMRYKIIIVLKGAHSSVSLPDGTIHFNSTGNPGMATAGSGDVLTGVILSLLAQGYPPDCAAIAGVFLHGLAGDLAALEKGEISLMAGDIAGYLPHALNITLKISQSRTR
ncbi:MAG: NAD(P)H-hydrate dehydratase, partial [Bacteroidales bacterium]|nr:NAD(P)H-hydrate dehydratase [Bacteroidales bacterium]